jgi:hypothetical protein
MAGDEELLSFALNAAFASLEGRDGPPLDDARAALQRVEESKVDYRDLIVARDVLRWAGEPAARDAAGMWRRIDTPEGPRLFVDYGGPFQPTTDLIAAALAIRDVLEQDAYRVRSMAVGGELPAVWLAGGPDRALRGVRYCVTIDATPSGDRTDDLEAQQFTVFLAEAAAEEHAALLAESAVSKEWHEALGVARGRACAVAVARAFVDGVPALEGPADLERFRAPFTRALEAHE